MEKTSDLAKQARNKYARENYQDNNAARKAYAKQWRDTHPEKVKEYTSRHWEKKGLEMQEQK